MVAYKGGGVGHIAYCKMDGKNAKMIKTLTAALNMIICVMS